MTISLVIGRFKMVSAKQINIQRAMPGLPVWQRNYYEHVIRNDDSLGRIRQYIADNPQRWPFDPENPAATQPDSLEEWV
jgi:REP element-mobilizing transposase RayT